jgi:anti-anti-sigma factor
MEAQKINSIADNITIRKIENTIELQLKGRIGYLESEYLEEEMLKIVNADTIKITVNCEGLYHFCSKAISLLINWHNELSENGGKVYLENLKPEIKQLLKLMGLHLLFEMK